jgi:ABC-type xylose transport system, periplasmic component
MRKITVLTCLLFSGLILTLSISGCGKKGEKAPGGFSAGLLMETYNLDRWKRDADFFIGKSDSLGVHVTKAVADGDQDRQNKQADDFLTQGVNVLVVIPQNLNTAGRIVKSAHEKNVPVIAYDRLILNSDVDIYITFDNEKVGYLQAKGILEKIPAGNFILLGGAASDNNAKMVRAGQLKAINEHEKVTGKKINILADPYLDNWDRDEARRKISTMLTKFKAEGKKVDAIIASNDATAGGVVAALMSEHEDGKVAVSGQDAELSACQRIAEGSQTVTVYKPVKQLATISAELAYHLAKKEKPEEIIKNLGFKVDYIDNGFKKVPAILLEPVFVTKDNMFNTVIKDGWQTVERVYINVPKALWPKNQ